MKCPWRPVRKTTVFRTTGSSTEKTYFDECYKGECPFYSPEFKINERLSTAECCNRPKQEVQK